MDLLSWLALYKYLVSISHRVRTHLISTLELGLILRSACYSAGLGLVLSPKISLKLGRVL